MRASTAYHLAAQGAQNILPSEQEELSGTGAAGRCAGGIRHPFATEINTRLSSESLPLILQVAEEHDQAFGYQECKHLFLLSAQSDVLTFQWKVDLRNSPVVEID